MDWLKDIIQKKPFIALAFPTAIGSISFFYNLLESMSDGMIDSKELHNLMASADAIQTVVLVLVMYAFKKRGGGQ